MQGRLWVLVALVVAALPAGALAPMESIASSPSSPLGTSPSASRAETGGDGPHVTDSEGDARESASWRYGGAVARACSGMTHASQVCYAPRAAWTGDVPAPADLDVLAASFRDTSTSLVVELQVAGLQDLASSTSNGEGGMQGSQWGVCWSTDGEECSEYVYTQVLPGDAAPSVVAAYGHDGPCNSWWWCNSQVPFELEPGSPALLRWTVPRAIMPNASMGQELQSTEAGTLRLDNAGGFVFAATAQAAGVGTNHWANGIAFYAIDETELGRPFAFTTAESPTDPAWAYVDEQDDIVDFGSRDVHPNELDIDVRSIEVSETPTELTITVHGDRIAPELAGQYFDVYIGMPDGGVVETFHVDGDGFHWQGTGRCTTVACDRWENIAYRLVVVPGSPGTINVTYPRIALGSPMRGALTNLFEIDAGVLHGLAREQGPAAMTMVSGLSFDVNYAPAYTFLMDTESVVGSAGPAVFTLEDGLDDVEVPAATLMSSAQARQFDITFLEARGETPSMSRITLGVADLSRVTVPTGFDAVLYAAGLTTAAGDAMIGYYKDASRQEFFCSQDTTVLVEEQRDPNEALWTPIEGLVSVLQGRQDQNQTATGGGTGAGAITFFVPNTCLGRDGAGPVQVERIAAGTYAIRNPGGRAPDELPKVYALDTVDPGGPLTLEAEPVVLASTPLWKSGDFWNLFGIAAAAVTSIAGAAIVQRKRQILKRYLAEIEHAVALNTDAKDREIALAAIEQRLKRDLMRGAIAEGHYVIVDRRLAEHLGSARAQVVAESFGDMPHKLLVKLQQILADGIITRDEARVFGAYLEDSGLTDEAKARIRRKLELWVDERTALETVPAEG